MLLPGSGKKEQDVLGCLLLFRKLLFGYANGFALISMHGVTSSSKIHLLLGIVLQRIKKEGRSTGRGGRNR